MTAVFWAVSPLCFASVGRRIGSYQTLLIRSLLAAVLLGAMFPLYAAIGRVDLHLPTWTQTGWLVLSSLAGMVVGDALYYEALVLLGPRRSTQVMSLAPVAAILLGWGFLNEHLTWQALTGIALVIGATSYAITARSGTDGSREPGRFCTSGVLVAAAGAACVGAGAAAGRQAFLGGPPLDGVLATVIRVGSCAMMLWVIPLVRGGGLTLLAHLRDASLRRRVAIGVASGPVGGMLCYLFALKNLEGGIVSTLTAMSPLFILPMIALRYRMAIGLNIALATGLAGVGVAMISLR